MQIANPDYLGVTLRSRRQKLAKLLAGASSGTATDFPVILWSGKPSPRNFPHNTFPFRASSHFLYFAGVPLPDAAIRLEGDKLELYVDDPDPGSVLWYGETPRRDDIAHLIGADAAFPKAALAEKASGAATILLPDAATRTEQEALIPVNETQSLELARAIVAVRLIQDAAALSELRAAAACTVAAHVSGMACTPQAKTESMVRAVIEGVFIAHNMPCAYQSIVTRRSEVLHNQAYHYPLYPGDLLLVDAGAETPGGWAADVTRTWPVAGRFSPTQRAIYDVVLAAHDACIASVRPGVEYQDVHRLACHTIASGLVDLGILLGKPEDLVEMNAHALFFPHGVGHLLGLDVHDMEDLGDIAGYEEGRTRSDRFGWCFLRLNRPLRSGMVVTIEPGFYQVPSILNDPNRRASILSRPPGDDTDIINWDILAKFADVRGIRIEDDVLVTADSSEVLTAALPTAPEYIEQLTSGGR
ncbi:aminopeptidase P family protein [[Phormidium] sp. ETS-05]|uniref:aminopeptidase P family protein n=1 Tax=[Phormidium] sp. ETS-05 TaxID=222819 RepID=UPI0018EF0B1F|nr:aminopeptidase P family protein [[Phormidium] sp. ETS-05]